MFAGHWVLETAGATGGREILLRGAPFVMQMAYTCRRMTWQVFTSIRRTGADPSTVGKTIGRSAIAFIVLLTAVACAPSQPERTGTSASAKTSEVSTLPSVTRSTELANQTPSPVNSGTSSTDGLYVCVTQRAGQRTETPIAFEPKVAALCARHPEMGPCQYARETCRQRGGRVFAANGQEITRQIENEYDRKVMRSRFRSN